ncbi:hypothetical protein HK100_002169 [Physocladia obscura]|uniref:Uncharacterized protein n=1 Tax=Physocladia obscura TaxID=109957 RepID=A0AAD5XAF2_9FUNG|nr:hypothetical protein HK100_002169 [Physocladia obscura]
MFAKSGRSTPIANSNGTNGSANMAPSVAAPGARPWLQKRQTQGHPNIINNNSNININGVTNAAAGPAVPVNTALAVQHTALVFNPGPSSGVSEVVQSRPVRRPLPQRNAPPATTSITAATTLANTNANINTSPTVSLVSAPNVAGIIPGAQRPNFPLRTRSSSNTNGNLNGKAQPLQRPTVQQMAYYSQFPQQQQQQPQQNLQQPSIQQQSLQQPVHQLLPPPSKQLYPLQMQQQLLSPPPQLQQPQQASPREQRPYHSPRPLTPSTPHYSRQQQQQQQDKLDRLMNEAQLDAQTNHATSPTPTQTSPLTVAASAGVSTTAGMPSSMIFVSLPQAPLVSSTGHQRQPSQGSITIPRVSSVTRNASNSSNSSRRSRITSVRAAGSTDLNAPNTSPSTISGTTPIPSFKSQRSSRLTLPISEKTLDVTSNDGSFSLESLKAFNARIEALESLNESLKLELSHKEKRIDAITAHTKETDRRLDQAQHDLRESDSKLRKLRGDRGSVISEVSLNSSKRVKSLRQGLADLEMLRQTEADQLRGFFSKEMKSKDSEIQRLTDALQAQLRAKAALSAVTNGAVASVGSAITGVIGGTAADDFAISVLLKQMELQKLKVADLEQKLAIYSPDANSTTIENGVETKQVLERRIQSLESQHSLEIDAITSEMEQLRVELDDVLKAYEDVELKREAEVARYESDKKELERLGQLEISDWKEKYKTMMNTFAKEKESLRAELTKMAAEVESTKRTHEKMLSEVSEKHAVQLNDVKTQMSQTFHQRNINSILGSVNEQLEQLMTEKTLVEASLVSCTQERDDSLKKLQEAGKTIETLTAHQKALEDGFATKIGNLVEKNKTLKEAKIDSDSQATMANSKFAALFSQFEALKADKLAENDRFKQELERLEKSRTALEMELNSSGHEFDDLIEKLRLAESAKAILEKDVEILNLQIEKLQSTSGTKISFEDESFLDSLATDKLRQDLLDTREKVIIL